MIGVWRPAYCPPTGELREVVNGFKEIGYESVDSLRMWEAMSLVATGSGAYGQSEVGIAASESATLPTPG